MYIYTGSLIRAKQFFKSEFMGVQSVYKQCFYYVNSKVLDNMSLMCTKKVNFLKTKTLRYVNRFYDM